MENFSFSSSPSIKSSSTIKPQKQEGGRRFKINKKIVFGVFGGILAILVIAFVGMYFFVLKPVLKVVADAKALKDSTFTVRKGLEDLNLDEIKSGLTEFEGNIERFKKSYNENLTSINKFPGASTYIGDGNHLIVVAEESASLGKLVVEIVEPYAGDLGLASKNVEAVQIPAEQRVVKLLNLMPKFSPSVAEISAKVKKIDDELAQIDAMNYPATLPWYVKSAGFTEDVNLRETILDIQSISKELSSKAPQMEAFFNAVPEFMGLNQPKRYLILMANNYELRMAGGFNTYIVGVEFSQGIPTPFYSIDTYFIDEGDRTGSSGLVNRNVPYHLRNYLYLSGNTSRLYARDATSDSPDFVKAADKLLVEFWRKDRSLPQNIDGVFQINNDFAVDILRAVGPVNTEKYSIKRDNGTYATIPVTEFNADNVIESLEKIAGETLGQTIGRKEIIKYLGDNILRKIYTSEATNLIHIAKVVLDSMSRKDIMLYSFDPTVQNAFDNLGYSGKIKQVPSNVDYLHVNRSNYGSGKADWSKAGFVTEEVTKKVELVDGKKISTVEVTIKNPKRPDWYTIDPCCFYRAYNRVYVPLGSKLVSVTSSDGQEANGAVFDDALLDKTYLESFVTIKKESDVKLTYVYELPDTIDLDNYKIVIQRQSGTTNDPYIIEAKGKKEEFLLNSDKEFVF